MLHFSKNDLPPVDAFWSVTVYGLDLFFVANPINRYAIGDGTSGLRYGKDGSLDVYIQHDPPIGHESNWLPTPAGAFDPHDAALPSRGRGARRPVRVSEGGAPALSRAHGRRSEKA